MNNKIFLNIIDQRDNYCYAQITFHSVWSTGHRFASSKLKSN